ncbi:MAG TPA: BatA domain-containing protein [Gemmatimonadaceae bacterium]
MSFLTPLWLGLAGLVGAALIASHFFRRTVPPQDVFPTVRFVPEAAPLTVLRSRRLTNVGLLLLRLAAVALLGLALAGAHIARRAPPRVVIVDVSRAVGSIAEVADSALMLSDGAVFVVADSTARQVRRDSLRALARSSARGSLSAAIAAAHRMIADRADARRQSELVIVSPFARESQDSATTKLLAMWEGPVRMVRVAVATEPLAPAWEVRTSGDDPVAAALGASSAAPATVRIVRTAASADDSAWAERGGVLVVWPREGTSLQTRPAADTQGAIATSRAVSVSTFTRSTQPGAGGVLVRWGDGAAAATEHAVGSGCIRYVAVPVDAVGDVALEAGFRAIARTLVEPCGGARDFHPALIAGRAALSAAPASAAADPGAGRFPLWLALGAAALLVAEHVLRNRERVTT